MRSPRPSPRRLALLGATGSIGRQVCDLVERHPDRFALHAVIAGSDAAALQALARRHPEAHALLAHPADARAGDAARAIADAVRDPAVDLVIVAAAGSAALAPTLAALEAGKDIPLATKEVLVMAVDHGAHLSSAHPAPPLPAPPAAHAKPTLPSGATERRARPLRPPASRPSARSPLGPMTGCVPRQGGGPGKRGSEGAPRPPWSTGPPRKPSRSSSRASAASSTSFPRSPAGSRPPNRRRN